MPETLFQRAPVSLVQVALDGTILAVNDQVLRISGYAEQELLGRSFLEFLHAEDRPGAAGDLRRIASGETTTYEAERRYVLKSGAELFVLERAVLVRPDPPAGLYCLSALHDLTLRRDLTETLRANEARLRLALEAGQMGTWDWDLVTGEARPSPEMGRLHGVSADELHGMDDYISRFVHPEDREPLRRAIADGIAGGTGHEVEYRVLLPDGSVRWLLGKGRPFMDEQGRPVRLSGICVDITARRQAQHRERIVAETSTVLANVLEPRRALALLTDLVVPELADWCAVDILSEDGEIERVAVTHRDPARVAQALELGRRWPSKLHEPGGSAQIIKTRRPILMARMTDDVLVSVARDPEHLAVLRSLQLRSAMGVPLIARERVVGALTMIMAESGRTYDEADLQLAEEVARRAATVVDNARLYQEAQEARLAREELLARVSHELRTPLNAIAGWTTMLRDVTEPQAARRGLDVVDRNVKSLTRLVDDLLDLARSTRDGLTLDLHVLDVAQLVTEAAQSVQPLADQKGVTLRLETQAGCVVEGDADRLQQVVWNLLTNAIRFTPAGGLVTARVRATDECVEVVVRDTGEGVPPGAVKTLFDPFRQGSRRRGSGLGLGLAIARQIVEAHGGTIDVESGGRDTGATFTAVLPKRTPA